MTAQRDTVQTMLDSSQRVRKELLEAANKLDSYIEVLKAELVSRGAGGAEGPKP